ncbi:MAG: hypothetical protein DRJ37_01175 [Thermoprotei archaeon]|nr:MAG: hypothetical protein DRJ37_01175 [Thermoprotei archaeon]
MIDLFEIRGVEKTALTIEEVRKAIIIVKSLAENAGYQVPEYMLILFVNEKEYEKTVKREDYVEIEDGVLVADGDRVVIKSTYIPLKLLEKIFIGVLTALCYNTFLVYNVEIAKELLREKYLYFLSLVYKGK